MGRLPGLSGFEVHQELPARWFATPVIFITGHAPMSMGARAFEILLALVVLGKLVSKEEFLSRAWPANFVGVSNHSRV
jgi:FixJ family two-component response regulator